ncbi:MAG: hypothetical protein MJ182_08185 [Treponema sp.]|nr:hypothetical protein [Treponema sp.]
MIPSYAVKHDTTVLVLDKEEEQTLSPRILELRKKIHDADYLNDAVQRIAFVISQKLVDNPEELLLRETDE